MPLIKKTEIGEGLLMLWQMTETPDILGSMLPRNNRNDQLKKITSPRRQKEWLTIRVMLNIACSSGILTYSETGQPELKSCSGGYKNISITHSDKLAGIFLHKKYRVGMDIENSARNFIRVQNKYLSEGEITLAGSIPNGRGLFWCIKEAVYKAGGLPGISFSNQIQITEDKTGKIYAWLNAGNTQKRYEAHHFEIEDQIIVYLTDEVQKEIHSPQT